MNAISLAAATDLGMLASIVTDPAGQTVPTASNTHVSTPNLSTAERHVALLTGSADTAMHVRLLHDSDKSMSPEKLYGSIGELWSRIVQAQQDGYGVFIVVNDGGNSDAEITKVRALFIDADAKALLDDREWHTPPDAIVQRDGTHWHAYWFVADAPVSEFRQAQKRLAAHYRSDPVVCNPSRIMRLAGTLHQKDPATPRLVTLREVAGNA